MNVYTVRHCGVPAGQRLVTCHGPTRSRSLIRPRVSIQQYKDELILKYMETEEDMRLISQMRADAFYEDQHFGRFVASYRKQFAEQEFRRLQSSQGGGVNIIASCSATGEQTSRATCVVGCLEMDTASPKDDMVEVYIKNVVVIPDYRRQGIARRMLEYAEVEAKGMGAVTLSVEVELANTNAVSLYQGFGFNRVDDGYQSENKSQTRVGRLVTLSKAI